MARCFSLILVLAAVAPPQGAWAVACTGPLPRPGQSFSGAVRFIADGDRVCVGDRLDPRTWVLVRLSDVRAARLQGPGGEGAKWRLRRLARGKRVDCLAHHIAGNHVVAECLIAGARVGDLLRGAAGKGQAGG